MSDNFAAFVFPHIIINLTLIVFFFFGIGRWFFSRPNWLLSAGIVFMAAAASEKYFLILIKPTINNFADLDPAILFLEVSVAALGGNLVASAFLLKAQMLHNKWETNSVDHLENAEEKLSAINRHLKKHLSLRSQMSPDEYENGLNGILNAIDRQEDKIEKIREELHADSKETGR